MPQLLSLCTETKTLHNQKNKINYLKKIMNKHPGSDQRCKIHVIGVWGGKEKKYDAEKIVEERILENFPILKEDMSIFKTIEKKKVINSKKLILDT